MNPDETPGKYDHMAIEKKWQQAWSDAGIYTVPDKIDGKDNFYELVEFTYPSGNLHVGHWYAFSVPDIHARYKRMQGFNVLYPMGFDAFGLPAENAAIKLGADPKVWTYEQMDKMRTQFHSMGAMFDWNREVVSCSPEYYKWTQWMFNQFLKHGLVYRAVTQVNWCPKDQTILANEQVTDGKCQRCGSDIIQREQPQWMLRITKYADRLIDDLDTLDWPHAIKESQKNWIGRSEGSEIHFNLDFTAHPEWNERRDADGNPARFAVFTTRADTLFGVTYVVLAPEHPWVTLALDADHAGVLDNADDVRAYVDATKKKLELERQQSKEKTGVQLKGVMAINPANGEHVPVWIADYVLVGYGTGAVMAVPAHDERDAEFATKFNIENNRYVIKPQNTAAQFTFYGPHLLDGVLFNSGKFDGLTSEEARTKITESVGGKLVKTYRLRDWGISRQRYWGCPIPIVYDPEGRAHAVPDEHLPWILPTDVDHTPDGTAPLARSAELFERTEAIFGNGWTPEVETMDTFVDSTWYFYRYLDNKNSEAFADMARMDAWMPIDMYMGGPEHTTMHVLYSRFWTKALYDIGLVKDDEPYKVRRNRGLILGTDGNKMSKSKGNVINPDEIVDRLGADTVRMYLAFMGPYGVTANFPWDPNGVVGVRRFLERVWRLKDKVTDDHNDTPQLHKAIKKVQADMEEYKFNTAISAMMILINAWEKETAVSRAEYKMLLQILAPFAPHMAEELWHMMGESASIHLSTWPAYDPGLVIDDMVTLGVQINGKLRANLTVANDADRGAIEAAALELPRIVEHLASMTVERVIVVPGRVINIVAK